jgi:hypothetical protein
MTQNLSQHDLGHLVYLLKLAQQPTHEWQGFYRTPADGMNFGLRFQVAFTAYALYALAKVTPAYTTPHQQALHQLIEKMLHPTVWAYWFRGVIHNNLTDSVTPEEIPKPKNSLQNAVEAVHTQLGFVQNNSNLKISPDPCRDGNVQYSGHLASLLGFYQLLSGDDFFANTGFKLEAEANSQIFNYTYTYHSLAARIHQQMTENYFHGLCCEPGRAYAACNNHACISNLLYDSLYQSDFAAANTGWANWVRQRMLRGENLLPLPTMNGLLSVAYMSDLHLPIPLSFNLTDAWGLAFMAAWQPELAQGEYQRFRKKLRRVAKTEQPNSTALQLGSLGPNEKLEISNNGLNTAFAYLLAREMGDNATASNLRLFAEEFLTPVESHATGRYYSTAKPAAYVTALFALGDTLPTSGGGLYDLVHWRPNLTTPSLLQIQRLAQPELSSEVAVTRADYTTQAGLNLTLQWEPTAKSTANANTVFDLSFANCIPTMQVKIDDQLVDKLTDPPNPLYNTIEQSAYTYVEPTTQQLHLQLALHPNQNFVSIQ